MIVASGNMIMAGGVLLAVVAIAYGGPFMLRESAREGLHPPALPGRTGR
jgi:hypothetical protein